MRKEINNVVELENLAKKYVTNKQVFDEYKKICDKQNKEIKEKMKAAGKIEVPVDDGRVIKYVVQNRESMNEEMLLEIAHIHGIPEIIKTKEYIDYDALEAAIYNGKLSKEVILEMDKAREVKEVVTLRITKI